MTAARAMRATPQWPSRQTIASRQHDSLGPPRIPPDIRLWDLHTGQCLRVFRGHSKVVGRLSWSRDQRLILSPSFDRTVRLWSVESGECLRVLEGHRAGVKRVVYTADESGAVSCDWSGEIRRWNLSGR